jgi:hypothetical protein
LSRMRIQVSASAGTVATALHHRMRVEELNELDLSYTPPLSSTWDPIQMAAQAWTAAQWQRLSRVLALLVVATLS